jgi:hypothetical protein
MEATLAESGSEGARVPAGGPCGDVFWGSLPVVCPLQSVLTLVSTLIS